jgi:GDP-4-dehydro-6-deoxy-D-mannose reductase
MYIVMTRSFNHIGPGQRDLFVISSFAKQLVEIKKGADEGELSTGDTSIIRDFVDVRDVVHAYYLLFKKGKRGEVYNICSGEGISLKEVITQMADILALRVNTTTNANLIRPNDNKVIIGSSTKLQNDTGWQKTIALNNSLKDIIAYWQTV